MYLQYKKICIANTNYVILSKIKIMILEEHLKQIIEEQNTANQLKKIIPRDTDLPKNSDRVIVVSGVRRCGKSTLLQQAIGLETASLTINFEDPRLEMFEVNDFFKIENIADKIGKNIFIFDEIQNIVKWEKYIRNANDKGRKLYITGSNASMLSKELGTKLTGRYHQIELFPFNYVEFLSFTDKKASAESYMQFLTGGGFPEYLKEQNPEYLRTLLKDIVIRDIAVRRKIKNEHTLIRLAVNLLSNIGKEFSYNKLTKTLNIKSVRSTIDYCDYLQENYLVEFIPRFSFSIHKQQNNPKKAYCIDTGMAKNNSLSTNNDYGRLLENAIYLQLRKYSKDIQYFKDENSECDFLIKIGNKITYAIQVCWQLTPENLNRELCGLKNAIKTTNAQKGIIITNNQEDIFDNIKVIPAWKAINLIDL